MSEIEDKHAEDGWETRDTQSFPDDFSLDEAEFAGELRDLFGPEREELPPLFTQTLLENARVSTAGPGFEQKTAYRVFRRLHLARSPLVIRRPSASTWRAVRNAPRSYALSFSLVLVFMVFTMVLASPAFGEGVRILLGRTGVEQVQGYPTHVRRAAQNPDLDGAQQAPLTTSMPVSWLGPAAGDYTYMGAQLFAPTEWSNGPIFDIQYTLARPGAGNGVLDIREFQVSDQYAAVLQVVQDGSATPIQVGSTPAVYVNGAWMPLVHHDPSMSLSSGDSSQPVYVWVAGERSELIFELNGVVFWVAADQRDGTGETQLVQLLEHLTPLNGQQEQLMDKFNLRFLDANLVKAFQAPVGMEVYQLVPQGASLASGTGVFVAAQAYGP